jgi:DNA repair protein RadC
MTLHYNLKELPVSERPRERLLLHGPGALSSIELIALILGSGTRGKSVLALAQELLSHFGSLGSLQEATIQDLCQVKGLGRAKAVQIKAAFSLAGRVGRERVPPPDRLESPLKAYLWVRDLVVQEKKEIFGAILLNAKGAPLRWEIISVGTLTQTLVHPREVFYPAIRYLAASLILIHNHPSGDPTPSSEDHRLTHQLFTVSRSVGIPILDHLIIGKQGFISLKENIINDRSF